MGTLRRRDFDRSERFAKSLALLETLAVQKGYRAFLAASAVIGALHRVRSHKALRKIKKTPDWVSFLFGGSGWIRTIEVIDNRFTVCPLWPLGYTPEYMRLSAFYAVLELVDGFEPPTC